ncbi:Chitin synthase, class 7 [Entomophthora muscae]|uniref:Chitin synthase, class 7 n=1 Tax=Entomophthora muscae TaxID=34485 RepID=A0ACC2T3S7_9FUNG|nr:Chitin synthase, class 7 [Entomophthora muscae]
MGRSATRGQSTSIQPSFFQPATLVMQICALGMTIVMIYNIKTKYTAVGRKEMVMFFYLYMLTLALEFVSVSGIIPAASSLFPYFVAAYYALISAAICCLMLNGFVGFQFAEDGTFWSLWTIRLISLIVFGIGYYIAIGTFLNVGLSRANPVVLWIWLYMIQGLALLVYAILQIMLVVNTLDDFWPIGNIILGMILFVSGQAILYLLSTRICDFMGHYVDGMFFAVICTLLSVMMVYKYWDSITKEDLEFSVSGNQNVWEVKELMEDANGPDDHTDAFESLANLNAQQPNSGMNNTYTSMRSIGTSNGLPSRLNHYHAAPTALNEKATSRSPSL